MQRRVYIKISEDWLQRLATIAEIERRDPRIQATCILEDGIAALEREYGLADPQQPPRTIEGVWARSFEHAKNGAGDRQVMSSAILS